MLIGLSKKLPTKLYVELNVTKKINDLTCRLANIFKDGRYFYELVDGNN